MQFLKAGLQTSVQDEGRLGYRKAGVPVSGCMDSYAAYVANVLVGNRSNQVVLEFTLLGPTILFERGCEIAITGGVFKIELNGVAMPLATKLVIDAGDILKIGAAQLGVYGYLACSPTMALLPEMGSRSMYKGVTTKARFERGDRIELGDVMTPISTQNSRLKYNDSYLQNPVVQIMRGPEFVLLDQQMSVADLQGKPMIIDSSSNRMAIILQHQHTLHAPGIITSPVQPGTVQLTPSGQLIVLMRDAQTTGGYARVLQLPAHSINQLAQRQANSKVYFELMEYA